MTNDLRRQVSEVAALADPIRRDLYLYVIGQAEPVSRDGAAAAVVVPRHTVKFHLDKLVEQGLLDVEFRRLSGRRGPGAGRPTKLYRRSSRQISLTLPERRYELAGKLLAQAVEDADRRQVAVLDALRAAAADFGRAIGGELCDELGPAPGAETRVSAICGSLACHGYEPRRSGDLVTLVNCPFDALARDHTALICGMNLAVLRAVADRVGDGHVAARLDPDEGRCCVVLDVDEPAGG